MEELPQLSPEGMDGPPFLMQCNPRELEEYAAAERINNNDSMGESAKIDALADARCWFTADTTIVDAYMDGELTLDQATERIAQPIEECYSSANHGVALWEAERVARLQRRYHSPEKALAMWGPEETFPEPDENTRSLPTTEGQLWDLWYAVLHAAKRIPWEDGARQEKLADLVKALKSRPDPALPERMTIALQRDHIWESRKLWSALTMLGISCTESWNDGCGFAAGWTPVEQRAWINVNAFVARLTASETAGFHECALIALECATEHSLKGQNLHHHASIAVKQSLHVKVASVWIFIAGRYMYERRDLDDEGTGGDGIPLEPRGRKLYPWTRSQAVTHVRWTYWRRMFQHLAMKDDLDEQARDFAERVAGVISSIQQERYGAIPK